MDEILLYENINNVSLGLNVIVKINLKNKNTGRKTVLEDAGLIWHY
jgi:hypothetical protein